MDDLGQVRLKYVRVTNGMSELFSDRYDGVPYNIEAGKTENIPLDVAAHLFGPDFDDREVMFKHVSKRQGWNTVAYAMPREGHRKTLARELFDKLKIEPVAYKLVEDKPDPRQPVPALQDTDTDPEAAAVASGQRRRGREATA